MSREQRKKRLTRNPLTAARPPRTPSRPVLTQGADERFLLPVATEFRSGRVRRQLRQRLQVPLLSPAHFAPQSFQFQPVESGSPVGAALMTGGLRVVEDGQRALSVSLNAIVTMEQTTGVLCEGIT